MTISADAPAWQLSPLARSQLAACGVAVSELTRLLDEPQVSMPVPNGATRLTGYGLTAVIDNALVVVSVKIDGASQENWSEWAAERAAFADAADLAAADEHLQPTVEPSSQKRRKGARRQPRQAPVTSEHILDRVNPLLHPYIMERIDGDFSRLIVEGYNKVAFKD